MNPKSQAGSVSPLLVTSLVLGVLTIGLAGVSVWAFSNYQDQKNNTDQKIAVAVDAALQEQSTKLEQEFVEREKQPTKQYNGPAELGSVSFRYPKTWSVYVAETDNKLETYLHPNAVAKISRDQPYALRVLVEDRRYEDILRGYESRVKNGDLKSNPVTINGFDGIRLEGEFSKSQRGIAVLFKVRDKTLTLTTDSTSYNADFNEIILDTLSFSP